MSIGSSTVLESGPRISQHRVTVTSDDKYINYDGASTWKGNSGDDGVSTWKGNSGGDLLSWSDL